MISHQINLVLVQQFCFVTLSTKPCFCHKKEVNAIIFYKRWYFTTPTSHIIALYWLCIKWSNNEWMQILFLPFYTLTWTMTAWKMISNHLSVSNHLSQRPPNKVLQDQTPSVSPAELLLSRETRRTLAQLRTNKSPLLVSYLFSIGDPRHPSPLCPLCLMHDHTSSHLFECKSLPTSLSSLDLWTNPDKVEPFLATWGERLLAATRFRVLDSAGSTLVEWGRQQQQQHDIQYLNPWGDRQWKG